MTRFFVVGLVLSMAMMSTQVWAAVDATVNTWIDLPNTTLQSVCPTVAQRPDLFGGSWSKDCNSITAAFVFASGWDETNQRLIIGGGGHATYYGDEPYGIYIEQSRIERLKPLDEHGRFDRGPYRLRRDQRLESWRTPLEQQCRRHGSCPSARAGWGRRVV